MCFGPEKYAPKDIIFGPKDISSLVMAGQCFDEVRNAN